MRNTKEILRQKWVLGRSHREVARSVGVSAGAVGAAISRATAAGLDWPGVESLAEDALEAQLYPRVAGAADARPRPDCAHLHVERRKPGVTLALLHVEYLEQHPNGYRYTQFCDIYRNWLKRHRLSMRQVHLGGDKVFVDYSGKKPHIVDPKTGECIEVELFVAALGASSYTFAEATLTQRGPDWIASHVRALKFFGGAPAVFVPDQLKSGVTKSCSYEPEVQRTYEELAQHYGTTVLPARPKHPRDKPKAEVAVQVAQRWILARMRNQTFFSLDALNERIAELLEELNHRTMRVYGESRRQLYERLDRPHLKALPSEPFTYGEWKTARVNIDYHVQLDHHFYSVPHALVHEQVDARMTATTIEIFLRGRRIVSHARSFVRGRHSTMADHMPKAHQKHVEWTPSRLIHWAGTIGPKTAELVSAILEERRHPEQGYRSCLGILRLSKRYGAERLEAACVRALAVRARSYRHLESMLKHGLDRLQPAQAAAEKEPARLQHENIRGDTYYQ
jgi:transposase